MTNDKSKLASLSPAALDAMERQATSQLLERTPAGPDRDAMRRFLEDPRMVFDVRAGEDKDPDGVRLLNVIVAVREARALKSTATHATLSSSVEKKRAILRIAMVASLSPADAGARLVVRREPGDRGRPLLILPQSATAGDMERGIRLALASIKKDGTDPQQVSVLRLHKVAKGLDNSKRGQRMLEHIKEAQPTQQPGLGTAKFATIVVY